MTAPALPKTPLTTLEFVRRTAGMSRPDLAERSGVSVTTILASERFGRVPHLATARRLAHALNLTVDELFPEGNRMGEERLITAEQALLPVKGPRRESALKELQPGRRRHIDTADYRRRLEGGAA